MAFQDLPIDRLQVNPANDRHGELRDERTAIDELFRLHDPRMRGLAQDICSKRRIFDPPLVMLHDDQYVVFDGNRRVACLKLISNPQLAPNEGLRIFFTELNQQWEGDIPNEITCQIETNRDLVDDILSRRHTGTLGGVGQIGWDARAKHNFIERTGRGNQFNVSASIEDLLRHEGRLPDERIPWSTLTRLLSSEQFRNRVGISTADRQFRLTHEREPVVDALQRITDDLSSGHLTLGRLWNNEAKRRYLDELEADGVLPTERHRLVDEEILPDEPQRIPRGRPARVIPPPRTLIPQGIDTPQWTPRQQRIARIWEELCSLPIQRYPNAVAALLRMLLELSVECYIEEHRLEPPQDLSRRVGAVARSLHERDLIDARYLEELDRMRRDDQLISVASMQRLLHSPDFAPMEAEFRAYWMRLSRFIIATLSL